MSSNVKPITFEPGIASREGGHVYEGVAGTLRANAGDNQLAVAQPIAVATQQGGAEIREDGICPTITAAAGMSGNNQPWICKPMAFTQNQRDEIRDLGDKSGCLQAEPGMKQQTFIIDSIGGQAERGWEGDVAPCLKASHYKFPPCVTVAAGFKPNQGSKAMGIGWEEEVSPTLLAGQEPAVCIKEVLPFDTTQVTSPQNGNNPKWGDPCHPLAAQGHPPTVICKTWDARGNGDGETVSTITGDHENRITDYTSVVVEEACYVDTTHADDVVRIDDKAAPLQARDNKGGKLICQPVYCLQGNGIDRADTAGCNGKGWKEDVGYTLNTIDRPAVVYLASKREIAGTLMASMATKQCLGDQEAFSGDYHVIEEYPSYDIDCRNMNEYKELYPTLQAKPNGGQSLNFSGAVRTNSNREDETMIRYIVRRLTPTECARLQGFPDNWGHPDQKSDFSDEEYQFWLDVRNTHAAINGKATKEYTKEQMLTWYNKLHTDSSEYKMWGNGIALPTALYVMQGIAELIGEEEMV